ncbi:MAG: hypothetical protein ABL983_22055 [Nitrospira sp.]
MKQDKKRGREDMREAVTSANMVRSMVVVLLFLIITGCQYTTEYQDARKVAYEKAYQEAYDSAYRAAWNEAYARGRDESYAVTLKELLHSGQYHYRFSYWMMLWVLGGLVGWLLQYWLSLQLRRYGFLAGDIDRVLLSDLRLEVEKGHANEQ